GPRVSGGKAPALLRDAYLFHEIIRLDLLHHVESAGDLAEHCVDTVQVTRVLFAQHHEELAAARVLARVRHRERAHLVRPRVAGGFALDRPARTSRADARVAGGEVSRKRIATLDDEIRYDAVKLDAIIEARVGELLEVADGDGCVLLIQLGGDRAEVRFERG